MCEHTVTHLHTDHMDAQSFPVHLQPSRVAVSEPTLYFQLLSAPMSFSLCSFPPIHRQNSV